MSPEIVETLKKVEFLAPLDDATLADLAKHGRIEHYLSGSLIVSELEFGADVFVLLSGAAEVSVEPRQGERQLLGVLEPGQAVGEMSSVTGQLRSATVTARGGVGMLRIPDAAFDDLRMRRPEVAVALVRILARRLALAEASVDDLLGTHEAAPPPLAPGKVPRGSISRAWRELVTSRGKDLAFLALAGFVLTLIAVRAAIFGAFHFDWSPREVLRAAYLTGFGLLILSACASLLTFRPTYRRAIALCYGIACALIANELGVTLAFDIFFKDIHTADPNVAFDVERLYRRSEPIRALVIAALVLVQAAYLRRFYRRVGFVLMTRLRRLASRSR